MPETVALEPSVYAPIKDVGFQTTMPDSPIPNFAVSMSFDGIKMLKRSDNGWDLVGDVSLDTDDLARDLAQVRARAEQLAGGEIQSKLLIPNSQIKYISIDDAYASEAEVRSALKDATPYSVDELVYDWTSGGGRTFVAAVARETLDEAEAFASEHALGPLCFAAVPEAFTFDGEAFFGASKAANGAQVSRDNVPVQQTGIATLEEASASVVEDVVEAETPSVEVAEVEPTEVLVDGGVEPTTQEAVEPDQNVLTDADLDEATKDIISDADLEAVVETAVEPEPAATPEASEVTDVAPTPEPELNVEAPAFTTRQAPRSDDEVALNAPITPDARMSLSVPADAPDAAPMLGGAARGAEPAPAPAPVVAATPAHQDAPTITGDAGVADAPPVAAPIAAPAAPAPEPEAEPAKPGKAAAFMSRRKAAKVAKAETAAAAAAAPVEDEASKMTIFGARKPKPVKKKAIGGKPRFLGIILTAILLFFLVVVGAFAAISEDGFAWLFGSKEENQIATGPVAVPVTVALPADPQLDLANAVANALPLDESEMGLEPAPVENLGQVLSPAEARRIYASTGVWQKAPRRPLAPRLETLDTLYIASIDPKITGLDAFALPAVASILNDRPLGAQIDPPAPSVQFDLLANGLVRPTPEGALTPHGVRVYAGKPPVIPPIRSEQTAEATTDATASSTDEPRVAPGGVALAAFRPQTRPSDLVEQIERNVLGGMTRAEAAKFRPRTRPAGLAPPPEPVEEEPVVAEVEPEVDIEEPQIEITDQAVAISLRPDARPRNMNRIVARAQRSAPQEQQAAAAAPRTVRPSGTTPRTVAQIATTENALNMRRVNLIGVYGRPNDRSALVRLSNGRYIKVEQGDRLDGGSVAAISESELRYVKSGRNITLQMPD